VTTTWATYLTMAEPIRENGWYRITACGWERVSDEDAELEALAGEGWDLVHVQIQATEVPLW
jgi:hypothetical protein